jgi:ribosomal protein S18 acetylase RimI-like enzyme
VFRDADLYLRYWPRVIEAFGGAAFAEGTADAIDDCGGVALWLPPGVGSDDETIGALASEAVPAADQDEVFGFMGQMGEFHPTEPHWYLPLIGVDFTRQGRGYGSALLRHALERLRPGSTARVPRGFGPAQQGALRASRIRRTRCDPSR